jgi:hypothetical protein
MRVKNLIKVIESGFTLVLPKEEFTSSSAIPDKVMNYDVKSVYTDNDLIIIKIEDSKDVQTLEDLGYSFEVGV